MPGFVVNGYGDSARRENRASGRAKFYYNYTWELQHVFGAESNSVNSKDNISLIYLKEATLPRFTVNKEAVKGASLEYKFANGVVWEDVRFVWYDTPDILNALKRWRHAIWTPQEGLKVAGDYKKDTILRHYLPDGSEPRSWVLFNSWPSQISHGDLTYTSSDVKLIEVAVSYDWAEANPTTEESFGSSAVSSTQGSTQRQTGPNGLPIQPTGDFPSFR